VLAAASAFFEHMLYPTIFDNEAKVSIEEQKHPKPLEITIADITPTAFKAMLQAVYTDQVHIEAADLPDIVKCADKYQIDSLRQLCAKFLSQGMTAQNACTILDSTNKLGGEDQFALAYIENNTTACLSSEGFARLSKERVQRIVESDKLNSKEVDVFHALLRWSHAECKRQELESSTANKKTVLGNLINLIRFTRMDYTDLSQVVSPSGLVGTEAMLSIYGFMTHGKKNEHFVFNTDARKYKGDKGKK
jgi:BTB/POZ domain-containing protein 1/2